MREVAELIGVKKVDTAKNWLKSKKIKIHIIANRCMVYETEVEYFLSMTLALSLKESNPFEWEKLLQIHIPNTNLREFIINKLSEKKLRTSLLPRVNLTNPLDKFLYQELLQ